MKRLIYLIAASIIFLFGVSFALRNQAEVQLSYYLGVNWQAPLYLVLLVFFIAGILAGYLASLRMVMQMQHQMVQAKKEVRQMEQEVNNLRALPIKDVI